MELIDLKWPDSMGQAKVINYRLIEMRSQTFNEGLFLPKSCNVSSLINAFEKVRIFTLRIRWSGGQILKLHHIFFKKYFAKY